MKHKKTTRLMGAINTTTEIDHPHVLEDLVYVAMDKNMSYLHISYTTKHVFRVANKRI
jgi:hypothetical protein